MLKTPHLPTTEEAPQPHPTFISQRNTHTTPHSHTTSTFDTRKMQNPQLKCVFSEKKCAKKWGKKVEKERKAVLFHEFFSSEAAPKGGKTQRILVFAPCGVTNAIRVEKLLVGFHNWNWKLIVDSWGPRDPGGESCRTQHKIRSKYETKEGT